MKLSLLLAVPVLLFGTLLALRPDDAPRPIHSEPVPLRVVQDERAGTIAVFRADGTTPLVTQHAGAGFRPYLHPIAAPDGKGTLTEYSPGHHKHQTGLYWGFTRVNGRDYFHHPDSTYWRRVSAKVLEASGPEVRWQTVYDLLDSTGHAVLTETQTWAMREQNGKFMLDLEWAGEAQTDVTIGKYDYGGLFLRMPWREGIKGEVVNAARQKNEKAEGQRAMWVDAGMQVEGRDDLAHIAIFDHPDNKGFPQPWRVDSQLGIGPARARTADWTIKKGTTETIKHELLVYTGPLNDIEMTNAWAAYTGNGGMYNTASLWGIAREEALAAKFLTPDEAVAAMTTMPGYTVNAWASEPMMTQPMAFCWDDRGRLWVAENRDYESRGKGFSNDGNSRILILEDTDHDGKADKRTVFLEGIPFPAAMAVGFDGLFLGAPPNLLFVPDRNHDDRADEADIEVRLTGWGIRDRHETLNSLHWGPDGWLYGCQGFATTSKVRKPVGKGRIYRHKDPFPDEKELLSGEGTDINGGVWRYHPTKGTFEVVAHGFSNPWGIDYDAKGQLFISACVIPHLWHIIPGGIYQRQGGQHFNPYTYSDIQTIADHRHRSAHGGARIYQSDAFPAEQKGRVFMCNIHEHAVLSDVLERKGSGFVGRHGDEVLLANNAQWVGFSMEVGPDGAIYALDWHDADICGQTVRNGETGRVFRIMPKQSLATNWKERYTDLNRLADKDLVALQTSPSDWHSRRARLILQSRAASGKLNRRTHALLQTLYQSGPNPDHRLRAMWTLHVTNGLTTDQLQTALTDPDEYVRAWAVQLLCEDKNPPATALTTFTGLARTDPSPVVRLYLASALQRISPAAAWPIAEALSRHAVDATDHNLPLMIWFGLEPLVKASPARALDLAAQTDIPLLAQYVARRLVDADATQTVVAAVGKAPKTQQHLLEGLRDGLEGRFDLTAPANWATVQAQLRAGSPAVSRLSEQVGQRFGDAQTTRTSMATLTDRTAPLDQRRQALQAVAARKRPELADQLPTLLNDPALRTDAIRAVAEYDQESLGRLLLDRYAGFNPADKRQVVQTLSTRPQYGWMAAQAIKSGAIPKRDVPPHVARQLMRVVGSGFVEIWGPIEQQGIDEKAYAQYQRLLTDKAIAKADPGRGELIFQRTCGNCHKMYGKGGNIGPELTGSNRASVDYILTNVLNPSGEIQDDYKLVVVTTRDGRTYSGNVVSENDRQLTMRIVGQDAVVINKSSIQSREVTPVSMMPVGLFDALTETEVLDLLRYMRTSEDISKR